MQFHQLLKHFNNAASYHNDYENNGKNDQNYFRNTARHYASVINEIVIIFTSTSACEICLPCPLSLKINAQNNLAIMVNLSG